MRALLVKGGQIERIDIDEMASGATSIRDLVGNTFTTAFRVNLPGGLSIDGYCDDEFLLVEHPDWNVVLEYGTLYQEPYAIGGPIVIVGGDNNTGESREMSEEEMDRFWVDRGTGLRYMRSGGGTIDIPTLRYTEWKEGVE